MNTKAQGSFAEIAVIKEFIKYDFKVALPYGDNSSYDLIVEDGSAKLYKIQVKSCQSVIDGVCKFKTGKNRNNNTQNFRISYQNNEVDIFALYCLELDEIYLVPFNEAGIDNTSIHIENPKNNIKCNIKFREDYLFSNQINKLFIV